jgi:hypothetical protein
MADTKYLSCAETAKLLRQALKESFPKQKFSVRSSVYSGGASIHVKWMDGPTAASVEPILGMFKASYFDGMIDYQGSRYHALDGAPVHFGSDFVFAERRMTKPMAEAVAAKVAEKFGRTDWAEVCGGEYFGYYVQQAVNGPRITDEIAEIEKALGAPTALESKTLARIAFTGDDGYGRGTVGREGKGGESCYAAQHEMQERARAAELLAKKVAEAEKAAPVVAVISHQLLPWVDPQGALRAAGLVKVLQ